MSTPTESEGLDRYNDLPPSEAVVLAWTELPEVGRGNVRRDMPVLARALDRLVEFERTPPNRRRPQPGSRPPLWQKTSNERPGRPTEGVDLATWEPLTQAELEEGADEWVRREMRDLAEDDR